jgi:hypothetical protein
LKQRQDFRLGRALHLEEEVGIPGKEEEEEEDEMW